MEPNQKSDPTFRPINVTQAGPSRTPLAGYVLAALVVVLGFFLVLFFNWTEEVPSPASPQTSFSPAVPTPNPSVPVPQTQSPTSPDNSSTEMNGRGQMDTAPLRESYPQ